MEAQQKTFHQNATSILHHLQHGRTLFALIRKSEVYFAIGKVVSIVMERVAIADSYMMSHAFTTISQG